MNRNWAGVSIALGLITLACALLPWPLLIVGGILVWAYRTKR